MRAIEQAQLLQRKAVQDLAVLPKLIGYPAISDETLGFHAQQAAEKLIKALLAQGGHEYPRTHDLGLLLDLLAAVFRYDDLPLEATIDRQEWLPLLTVLEDFVGGVIAATINPLDSP